MPSVIDFKEEWLPHQSLDFQLHRLKAMIMEELFDLSESQTSKSSIKNLQIQTKPSKALLKALLAKEKILTKKLILVPSTVKIQAKHKHNKKETYEVLQTVMPSSLLPL